ncbi:MAG: hypothetical protein JXD23_07840 [Spirochaetales bacterium]|nr:hypothetical protein [Spirochaetales bacterium]
MRVKITHAVLLAAALFASGGTMYGQSEGASPEILQPNGGEIWYKGSLQTVAWGGSLSGQVGIELFKGSALKKKIGTVDASSGVFLWKVSSDLPAGDDYRIKIVRGSASDFSDGYFSIQSPPAQGNRQGENPPDDRQGDKKGGPSESAASLRGNWIGGGAGEEVRFRNRNLTLTVKHATKFFLYINEKDEIEGEGTIEYDLDRNTEGLDELVSEIRGMISAFVPGVPSAKMASGPIDYFTKRKMTSGLQYDAPHLKNGPELRHIKIRGRVEKQKLNDYEGAKIHLEVQGDFTLPDGKADNQLIAAWEVNKVKEESKFPCWSPFLKGPGVLRKGPGGYWVVEFQEKGEHRNRVKVWQEYGYYWTAHQIQKEEEGIEK